MTPRRQIAIALRVLGRDETAQIIRIAQWQAARTYREGCGASIKTYQTQAVLWRLRWEVRRALRRGLVWGSAQWSALDSSDEASPAARCASPGPSTEDVVEARRVAA